MTSAPFIDGVDIIPDDWERRTRPLSQLPGGSIYMIAHHAYALTLGQIIATFKSPNRTVTANLAIGPRTAGVDDYDCIETVPIDIGRAYTTSSSYDNVALTFEMANLSLNPPYPVGQSGKEKAAQVVAWLHVTYGMPIDRWHVTCHREVYQRGWGSYATACPGDDLHGALDWICARAREIVATGGAGGGTSEEEELMAAKDDIITAVSSIVRREERFRRFGDNKGRRALGRPGAVIALSSKKVEADEQERQIAAANPLLLPVDETLGILPVLDETAFFTLVDAYGGAADDYGVFVKNTFDITVDGGPTKMVRKNLAGNEFEVPYGSRQLVWASAQPVECTYDGVVVLDFVNNAGKYEARLADGTVKILTEAEVARANAQRPDGQNWAVG